MATERKPMTVAKFKAQAEARAAARLATTPAAVTARYDRQHHAPTRH